MRLNKDNLQIWYLKKMLPKLMDKANRAVAREEKAERKLTELYTKQAREARRKNGLS